MVSEKWNFRFDIQALVDHLHQHVLPLEITSQSAAFGGWSVLSSTGSHKDGWHRGHLLYRKDSEALNSVSTQGIESKTIDSYTLPTEICHGYLREVIETLSRHNLTPCRARIIRLTENTACVWHRDAPDDAYAVRLHIPIVTNEGCYFETEEEREHLKADGSAYFIFVNREHRVVNHGSTPRYHLVVNVIDRDGVTQHHRFDSRWRK